MLGFRHHPQTAVKQCTHGKAVPRWDQIEDTGNPDRISSFYCSDCDRFLPGPLSPDLPPLPAQPTR